MTRGMNCRFLVLGRASVLMASLLGAASVHADDPVPGLLWRLDHNIADMVSVHVGDVLELSVVATNAGGPAFANRTMVVEVTGDGVSPRKPAVVVALATPPRLVSTMSPVDYNAPKDLRAYLTAEAAGVVTVKVTPIPVQGGGTRKPRIFRITIAEPGVSPDRITPR